MDVLTNPFLLDVLESYRSDLLVTETAPFTRDAVTHLTECLFSGGRAAWVKGNGKSFHPV